MARKRNAGVSKMNPAERVMAERRAILARLSALTRGSILPERGRLGSDDIRVADRMDDAQESAARELELNSREIRVARLKKLARAEQKIREGTYGRCDTCGQPIPAARLRVVPEAVRCVPCAEQQEQRSALVPQPARGHDRRSLASV